MRVDGLVMTVHHSLLLLLRLLRIGLRVLKRSLVHRPPPRLNNHVFLIRKVAAVLRNRLRPNLRQFVVQFTLLLIETVLEHISCEIPPEHFLDLHRRIHLSQVLLANADSEKLVIVEQVLLVDPYRQLAAALLERALSSCLLIGKYDLTVETVLVGYYLVCLKLVQTSPTLTALLCGGL